MKKPNSSEAVRKWQDTPSPNPRYSENQPVTQKKKTGKLKSPSSKAYNPQFKGR